MLRCAASVLWVLFRRCSEEALGGAATMTDCSALREQEPPMGLLSPNAAPFRSGL